MKTRPRNRITNLDQVHVAETARSADGAGAGDDSRRPQPIRSIALTLPPQSIQSEREDLGESRRLRMPRKSYSTEPIITKLRQAEA